MWLECSAPIRDDSLRGKATGLRAARTSRQTTSAQAGAGRSCASDADLGWFSAGRAGERGTVTGLVALARGITLEALAAHRHALTGTATRSGEAGRRKATAGRDCTKVGCGARGCVAGGSEEEDSEKTTHSDHTIVRLPPSVKSLYACGAMAEEKFPHEKVEELKLAARLEEVLPDTESCPDCKTARGSSGDPTDLCALHLRKVFGV
jgi:hypothetical protein